MVDVVSCLRMEDVTKPNPHINLILIPDGVLVERTTEGGEMERNETIHPISRLTPY